MLEIPSQIKELLLSDSISKNFRISFPNGEREDITNSNLVSESVRFTESICSRDELHFGLCEGSVLEFECFNVGNIKDMTIDAQIEIIVTETFENAVYKEDIDAWVYPIPYGQFIVSECKRNASNMQNRKCEAHSKYSYEKFNVSNAFNKAKLTELNSLNSAEIKQNIDCFLCSEIADLGFALPKTIETASLSEKLKKSVTTPLATLSLELPSKYKEVIDSDKESNIIKTLFGYDGFVSKSNNEIEKELDKLILNASEHLNEYARKIFLSLADRLKNEISYNFYKGAFIKHAGNYADSIMDEIDDYKNCYYPYASERATDTVEVSISIPYGIQLKFTYTTATQERTTIKFNTLFQNPDDIHIYTFDTSSLRDETFVLSPRKYAFKESTRKYYKAENQEFDYREMLESYCELQGAFGQYQRDGAFDLVKLGENSAIYPSDSLYPSDDLFPQDNTEYIHRNYYSSAWYDDVLTKYYSKVIANYMSTTDEESQAEYVMVDVEETDEDGNLIHDPDEYQVYDASNNYFIKNNKYTEEQMKTILQGIGDNISNVFYMPSNITMRGMPHYEAGDAVQVITQDGAFDTYILRRTLSGIQALKDVLEAN